MGQMSQGRSLADDCKSAPLNSALSGCSTLSIWLNARMDITYARANKKGNKINSIPLGTESKNSDALIT